MTTTSISPTGLSLLTTERTARPERRARSAGVARRVGSFLVRQARALSVANRTPSEQAMTGLSSIDRPMR